MRLAAPLLNIALAATLLAGCGSSDEEGTQGESATEAPAGASANACDSYAVDAEGLRVTGLSCKQGRQVMFGWQRAEGCGLIGGASRGACSVRSYRCLATRTDRGISVSCAQPGRSVAFVAKRG
jgi:hypothetical protein